MPFLLSLFLFLNLCWGSELEIPALNSPVMDEAGLLSESQREDLAGLAYEINTHQGPQITIFTVNDLQGYPIEEFSIRVAEKWKLGTKKRGNGLLIIIAKNDRKMRIEVGEGIEGEITDYEAGQYIRNVLTPYFKQGDFHTGLKLVMLDIAKKFNLSLEEKGEPMTRESVKPITMAFPHLLPLILIALLATQIIFRNNTPLRGFFGGAGVAGAGFAILGFASIFFIVILFLIGFVFGLMGFHNVLYALASSSRGGRGGYGGGGFGGSGGWGGGGGGFSGGGSSGSW